MKPRHAPSTLAGIAALATLSLSGNLMAVTITWDGDTSTNWADGANWTGGNAPANDITTDIAVFNAASTNQPSLGTSRSVNGIDFANATGGWTLSGSGTLTLGSKGIDATTWTSGTNTVSVANIIMGSSTDATWSVFANTGSIATASQFDVSSDIQLNSAATLDFFSNRSSGAGGGIGTINLSGDISGTISTADKRVGFRGNGASSNRNTINITGANTYEAPTLIQAVNLTFNSLANAGSASSFGSSGTITLVDNTSFAVMSYTGTGSGQTDRLLVHGGSGAATINNNSNNTTGGTLSFNNTSALMGGTASNRSLTLGGTYNGGVNTMAAQISDMTGFTTSLTKGGASTWKLTNTSNSFSGNVAAVGGELQMDTMPDGGAIAYNGGIVTYTGATADTSNRLLQIGTVGGNITAVLRSSGAGTLDMTNTGAVTQVGGITAGSGLRLGGANTGDNYFRSSLGDLNSVAIKLEKADAGKWILTNTNAFTGGLTLSGGTLGFNADAALGATGGAIAFTQNADLVATGSATLGSGRTITVSSTRTASFGITSASGTTLVIDSKITGSGGNVSRVSGSAFSTGTVRYANDTNDYTGSFSTRFGVTEYTSVANAGNASALGAGSAINANNGASAAVFRHVGSANSSTDRAINWSATTGALYLESSGSGSVKFLDTTALVSGDGNKTLFLGGSNTGDNTLAQPIGNGPSSGVTTLEKANAGKWLLTGASTYTGATTVSAGTLLVNGSLGDTTVTVGANGTLGGTGTIGTNSVTNTLTVNGTLAPGNSPGVLTIMDDLSLAGVLAMEIVGLTAGNGSGFHDQVALNGIGTLGGTLSLAWALATAAPVNTELLLILNDGTDALGGSFSNAANLSQHTDNLGNKWELRYAGGSGNDLTLVAVPEPSVAWLALLGLGMATRHTRRRHH